MLFSEKSQLSPGSRNDSRDASVANAQQEPAVPWFFTGDTLPELLRSYKDEYPSVVVQETASGEMLSKLSCPSLVYEKSIGDGMTPLRITCIVDPSFRLTVVMDALSIERD
jgi:hypothetical protein